MKWHVITRVGESDTFVPTLQAHEPRIVVPLDRPTDPWRVQENMASVLERAALAAPRGTARDLINLGISVYTADVRVSRGFGDDKWQREFTLHLPVSNVSKWNRAKKVLVDLLAFLTGDLWDIEFREAATVSRTAMLTSDCKFDAVCLFSGGLDSLVGAIDRLKEGQKLALVGHRGAGLTNTFQDRTLIELRKHYDASFVPLMFRIQPAKRVRKKRGNAEAEVASEPESDEKSMRARSILFFSLGIAITETLGEGLTLSAAENGLISLNVPLTMARQGSLSTRTTHPYVIDSLRHLLKALGMTTNIEMPYRFQTKGEMMKQCTDQIALAATTPLTMSCSHPEVGRWQGKPGNHCGYCVPCIIRRAATFAAKVRDAKYVIDPRKDPPPYTTQRGRDLRAFEIAIERYFEESRQDSFASVISTGPIAAEDVPRFVDTYRNGMEEVAKFVGIKRPQQSRKIR